MTVTNVPPLLGSGTLLTIQALLFLLLNLLDGWTTWLVLKPDRYERERNPIARWAFRKLKAPGGIVLFKTLILSGLGIFIAYWWREALTINIALLIGNLLFLYVVPHNYKVYKRYQRREQAKREASRVNWIVQ